MSVWNNNSFFALSQLYGNYQLLIFYGGVIPPNLPREICALDEEIASFVVRLRQQDRWVYSLADWSMQERFRRRALLISRPLLERRRMACELFNQGSDQLCSAFPPEILGRIFEFVVGETNMDNPLPVKLSGTLRLASVTRMWRSIVVGNPQLWTSFYIPVSNQEDAGDSLAALDVFFQRSGTVHIHIQFDIQDAWPDHLVALVDIVKKKAPCIRTLCLKFSLYIPEVSDYISLFNVSFPAATTVSIISSNIGDYSLHTPSVNHLQIHWNGISLFRRYLRHLTYLDIKGLSLYQLWTILQATPLLETLKVETISGDELVISHDTQIVVGSGLDASVVNPLVHTALQVLEIHDSDILHMVTLPNLTSLHAFCSHDAIVPFLERSQCHLFRLGLDSSWAFDALLCLPHIQELLIVSYSVDHCISLLLDLAERTEVAAGITSVFLLVNTNVQFNLHGSLQLETIIRSCGQPRYLNISASDPFHFSDLLHVEVPENCSILVNGESIYHYRSNSAQSPSNLGCWVQYEDGHERLDYLDRAMIIYFQIRSLFSSVCTAVGNIRPGRQGAWERSGWGQDYSGTWN